SVGVTYFYAVWAQFQGLFSPQPATTLVTGQWYARAFTTSGAFWSSGLLQHMTVYAWGAGGGGALNPNNRGGRGGGGGFATATVFNPAPEQYRVLVGKPGRSGEMTAYDAEDTVGRGGYGNCSDTHKGVVSAKRGGGGGQMSGVMYWH